jgi:iron complex transport system substrate-binding protein
MLTAAGFAAASGAARVAWAQEFVDSAGRAIRLSAPPRRILAAGPPASVALYAVAPDRLLGWTREPRPAEKEFLAAPYGDLPVHGRLTGRGNTASLETVLALKPDLILDMGSTDETYVSLADRVQAQTGIPYALIDGAFARTPASLRLLGRMIGAEEAAEGLAEYAESTLGELAAKLSAVPPERRPRVYYGRGPEGLETGLAGSINVEVLETVGAVNVAAAAGSGGLTTVSPEQILAWNPGVILALDAAFYNSGASNPLWQGIAAIRDRRIYLQPRLPFGWFDSPPGINRLIGVRWLMAVLYPDLFPQDLREETRGFYHRFYHVDLDQAQLDRLLRDATEPPA